MVQEYSQHRPVIIDTFDDDCLQKTLGGNMPNSLIVVGKEGKVALWQFWSKADELGKRLEEMTGVKYTPLEKGPEPVRSPAKAPSEANMWPLDRFFRPMGDRNQD